MDGRPPRTAFSSWIHPFWSNYSRWCHLCRWCDITYSFHRISPPKQDWEVAGNHTTYDYLTRSLGQRDFLRDPLCTSSSVSPQSFLLNCSVFSNFWSLTWEIPTAIQVVLLYLPLQIRISLNSGYDLKNNQSRSFHAELHFGRNLQPQLHEASNAILPGPQAWSHAPPIGVIHNRPG